MESFNWVQYLANYPDLQKACIQTKEQAFYHYTRFGKNENRTDKPLNNSLKITVITPCTRPGNLKKIYESLNFDYICEWIIVYDGNKIESNPHIFQENNKIEKYVYKRFLLLHSFS